MKTYDSKGLIIKNLSMSGTECFLYFDKGKKFSEILVDFTKSTRPNFWMVMTEKTTKTIFSAADDYGTSYYFAGAATDNYVKCEKIITCKKVFLTFLMDIVKSLNSIIIKLVS